MFIGGDPEAVTQTPARSATSPVMAATTKAMSVWTILLGTIEPPRCRSTNTPSRRDLGLGGVTTTYRSVTAPIDHAADQRHGRRGSIRTASRGFVSKGRSAMRPTQAADETDATCR